MKEQLKRLGRGTIIYGAGQIITKLISFLLLPLFTAYLTPSDYGIISILAVISFLAAPVFGLGLGNAVGIVYFENDNARRKQETIWTSFAVLVTSSIIFLSASFLFSEQISFLAFQTAEHGNFVVIVSMSTVFNSIILQPFTFRLQFEEKSKVFVLLTIISTLITVGFTVLFVVILHKGVEGFIIASLIGSVITFLLYFFSVIGWTKFSLDISVAWKLLKYGCPMIPAFIFVFIIQNSGRYMLQWYKGLDDVGIYTIGNNFGMVINIAVSAFITAWFPYFNSFINKQEEAKLIFSKIFTYYIFGFGTLSVLFFIFAKPLVELMTQPPFHDAYTIVGMISAGNFFTGIFSILLAGVYFARKVYISSFAQFGAAVVCVCVNFLFIPIAGMAGAAISFLIANICMSFFQYILNRRKDFIKVEYEWRRILYFSLQCIVVALVCFLPLKLTFVQDVFIGIVLSGIFVWAVYLQLWSNEKKVLWNVLKPYLSVLK